MADLASATREGSLLELISVNQQRMIGAPAIIEAVLANPERAAEAERRVRETRREFFEKEFGVQQVAEEMRARGMTAAAEFIEAAESAAATGATALSVEDAWLLAEHVEVSDDEIDESWLPSERIEELLHESEEQRAENIERIIEEAEKEIGDVAPERVSLIRRIRLIRQDSISSAEGGPRGR